MIRQAASYLPEDRREPAIRATYLAAAGFSVREIAAEMDVTSTEINTLRTELGSAVVSSMHHDGYTDGEICTTLGIATTGRYSSNGQSPP